MEDLVSGCFLLGAGAWVMVATALNSWRAHGSARWPVAKGRITKSTTYESKRRHGVVLVADVEYEYEVGSRRLIGSTVRHMQPECTSEFALGVIQKYPLDKAVEVRHHPDDPEISCLEPGLYGVSWITIPVGLLFVAVGLWVIQ